MQCLIVILHVHRPCSQGACLKHWHTISRVPLKLHQSMLVNKAVASDTITCTQWNSLGDSDEVEREWPQNSMPKARAEGLYTNYAFLLAYAIWYIWKSAMVFCYIPTSSSSPTPTKHANKAFQLPTTLILSAGWPLPTSPVCRALWKDGHHARACIGTCSLSSTSRK